MVPTEVPEVPDRSVGQPAEHGGFTAPPAPPVLVIDDDPAGAAATRATLAGGGYGVAAEAAGDAVLRLVRASLVRLVVSELYIPCAEGRCVVTALKQDRARLPHLEWALGAGADAVVPKPARGGVLLREVGRLLDDVQAA